MPIIWQKPDGSVAVTQIEDRFLAREARKGEAVADAVLRLAKESVQAKDPSLAGLTPILVKSTDIPMDRTLRHAWRLKDGKVEVDATVPDPVDPKETLRAEVEAATTVAQLKAVVKKVIG